MDIPPVIRFPTDYTPQESDEFYRGYWEGLNEWQELTARVTRRDRLTLATISSGAGLVLGSATTLGLIALF